MEPSARYLVFHGAIILLIGLVLKLLKVAIILAVCVGIVMFAQNKLGNKRIR